MIRNPSSRRTLVHAGRAFAASALFAFAALAAAPALAGERSVEVRTTTVRFTDLDMHSDAGARSLYARLKAAARIVCEDAGALDVQSKLAARQCRKAALERAVDDAAQPMLTALHRRVGNFG